MRKSFAIEMIATAIYLILLELNNASNVFLTEGPIMPNLYTLVDQPCLLSTIISGHLM